MDTSELVLGLQIAKFTGTLLKALWRRQEKGAQPTGGEKQTSPVRDHSTEILPDLASVISEVRQLMRQNPFPGTRGIEVAHRHSIDAISERLVNMIEEAREKVEAIEEASAQSDAQSIFIDTASDLHQQQLRAALHLAVLSGMMCGTFISNEFHEQSRELEERTKREAQEEIESLITKQNIVINEEQQRALVDAIAEARLDGCYASLLGSTDYQAGLDFNAMVEQGLRDAPSDHS